MIGVGLCALASAHGSLGSLEVLEERGEGSDFRRLRMPWPVPLVDGDSAKNSSSLSNGIFSTSP